jgi:lysophospholipase L1-like esterase
MFDCLILGDSIGVGVASELRQCSRLVQIGYTSANTLVRYNDRIFPHKVNVVSVGTNDTNINTERHARLIREKFAGETVIWIMPNKELKPYAYDAVKKVAERNGDHMIEPRFLGPDNIHPTVVGYQDLAKRIEKVAE